jgi:hypothetical protein
MLTRQNYSRPKINSHHAANDSEMLVALILMHALTLRSQSQHSRRDPETHKLPVSLFSESQKF